MADVIPLLAAGLVVYFAVMALALYFRRQQPERFERARPRLWRTFLISGLVGLVMLTAAFVARSN